MNKERKILIFYPHNFFELSSGTHRRIIELLVYLKERGFIVDIFSISGFTNLWHRENIEKANLFRNAYIFKWRLSFRDLIKNYWRAKSGRLFDLALTKMRRQFQKVVAKETYSYVLVSYIYWAGLINYANNAVKIIDLHDFVTLNEYMRSRTKNFNLGLMFQDEINAINRFDYALSISEEETLFLEPFCTHTKFINAPIAFQDCFKEDNSFNYDILFVGSGTNPFNRDGILWFMEKVYPLLSSTVSIAVVGGVCTYLKENRNLYLMHHVDSLDDIYCKTKVVICPLLGGTGLKVKLVEALSFGKPVVTTKWGLSGIIQKENNGCVLADGEENFAKALNKLLTDKGYYQIVQAQAVEFFKKKFTRGVCWRNLDSIFLKGK